MNTEYAFWETLKYETLRLVIKDEDGGKSSASFVSTCELVLDFDISD
jgi:hypothetical protein